MQNATIGKIAAYLEELAPLHWAEPWDNVGLQVGDPGRPVKRMMVALELTTEVLEEALQAQVEMLVVHHPAIFQPLKALRFDTPAGRRLERLVQSGVGLYAAHTNLDVATGGTNDTLAAAAGLKEHGVLSPTGEEPYLKLVVYVPHGHEEAVREALAGAGAGHIGNYSHCTFQVEGTGTFKPLAGSNPFSGTPGQIKYETEFRLETILPQSKLRQVVAAMTAAHPYEEVAYDLFTLANPGRGRGHGRIGRLEEPVALGVLAGRMKEALGIPHLRLVGDAGGPVTTVAVGAGAGESLIAAAAAQGADVLITGDVKYHAAQNALDLGLALIDVGHFASEQIVIRPVAHYLRQRLAGESLLVAVLEAQAGKDPFEFL